MARGDDGGAARFLRRAITLIALVATLALVVGLSPALFALTVVFDLSTRAPLATTRAVFMVLVYLAYELMGVLIATAARYGAMFGGSDAATVEIMREYGERLGMAFQLADDLIDIGSDGEQTGKTPGTDLREGKRTLPVLHALASTDPADARLQELLLGDLSTDDALAEAVGLLRAHPAMGLAREHTYAVASGAQDVLAPLPASDAKAALLALATGVVTRVG